MVAREFDLIDYYLKRHQGYSRDDVILGIGDDGAIVDLDVKQSLVVSSDSMHENVHFFQDTEPDIIGYRSLAGATSDLLAMGARPCWASLALSMPGVDEHWLSQLCTGFNKLLKEANMQLIGGDLCRGPTSLTWQVLGQLDSDKALRRDQAQSGELLAVTGELGGAGAYCQYRLGQLTLPTNTAHVLQDYWAYPQLPWSLAYNIASQTNCGIDVSDGLLPDLQHITQASQVGAEVWADALPIPDLIHQHCSLDQALSLALTGGEDYQLLVTIPDTIQSIPSNLTVIGRVTAPHHKLQLLTTYGGEVLDWPQSMFSHFN